MKDVWAATKKWVSELNAIPLSLIKRAYCPEDLPLEDSNIKMLVSDYTCTECGGTIDYVNVHGHAYDGYCDYCGEQQKISPMNDFPIWGTLWMFNNPVDEAWAYDNLDVMKKCGFWVYESDELGLFFGIDGAGYDFYERHWIPLYIEMQKEVSHA